MIGERHSRRCAEQAQQGALKRAADNLLRGMDDDLIPLKRVAAELGVSRATLWRVSRSAAFPPALRVLGRVYWRSTDLKTMEAALDRFKGRCAFERERRNAKVHAALVEAAAGGKKRKRPKTPAGFAVRQPDLFGGAEAPAPAGAERRR